MKSSYAAALGLCAASCASQPPDWVMRPVQEGGFAATECVSDSGNLSLDRQVAVAKARAEIAKQIELRVAAMDKTYARLAEESAAGGDGKNRTASSSRSVQTAFESVSKQIAEQTLSGLVPARVEYVDFNDQRNLCALIAVDRTQTRQVYDHVVQASGRSLAPTASETLYREFSTPAAN